MSGEWRHLLCVLPAPARQRVFQLQLQCMEYRFVCTDCTVWIVEPHLATASRLAGPCARSSPLCYSQEALEEMPREEAEAVQAAEEEQHAEGPAEGERPPRKKGKVSVPCGE